MKDNVKAEIKATLFKKFQENAALFADLFIREVKKKDGKAKKELKKFVIPIILKILKKYNDPAIDAGMNLSEKILSGKIKKTPHWWTKAEKKKWLKRKRELIDTNEGYAISLLEMACDSYIIDTEALLMEMISAGTAKEKVKEKIAENIKTVGRETGKYFNAVSDTSESYLFRTADKTMKEAFEIDTQVIEDSKTLWKWVTFHVNSCPDCIERHGQIKSYAEWEAEGLPRTGMTVCRSHCHCVLVPTDYEIDVKMPLPRERAKLEGM